MRLTATELHGADHMGSGHQQQRLSNKELGPGGSTNAPATLSPFLFDDFRIPGQGVFGSCSGNAWTSMGHNQVSHCPGDVASTQDPGCPNRQLIKNVAKSLQGPISWHLLQVLPGLRRHRAAFR